MDCSTQFWSGFAAKVKRTGLLPTAGCRTGSGLAAWVIPQRYHRRRAVWAATKRGYDIVGAFVLAFVTGVGGGLMRDLLVREEPWLLKPGQLYFLATLVGCSAFVVLSHHYGMQVELAAYAAIALTLLLRVLAIRFNWRTSAFGWRR